MSYYQYIRVHYSLIPLEIIQEYNLKTEKDGYVYFEIRKGIYGLKEAGVIAFTNLVEKLKPFGYEPMKYTLGLWRHTSLPTTCTLCVDDFGVKYFQKSHALHLIQAVQSNYECTIDWTGNLYCGLYLRWNYKDRYVDVSMDGYVSRALKRFDHKPTNNRKQHSPHPWSTPIYGHK